MKKLLAVALLGGLVPLFTTGAQINNNNKDIEKAIQRSLEEVHQRQQQEVEEQQKLELVRQESEAIAASAALEERRQRQELEQALAESEAMAESLRDERQRQEARDLHLAIEASLAEEEDVFASIDPVFVQESKTVGEAAERLRRQEEDAERRRTLARQARDKRLLDWFARMRRESLATRQQEEKRREEEERKHDRMDSAPVHSVLPPPQVGLSPEELRLRLRRLQTAKTAAENRLQEFIGQKLPKPQKTGFWGLFGTDSYFPDQVRQAIDTWINTQDRAILTHLEEYIYQNIRNTILRQQSQLSRGSEGYQNLEALLKAWDEIGKKVRARLQLR